MPVAVPFPPCAPRVDDDATRCPLCGADNRCAVERERATGQAQPPCWCLQPDLPALDLKRLPPEVRGVACLCPACMAALRQGAA